MPESGARMTAPDLCEEFYHLLSNKLALFHRAKINNV
jgi:hypothetical protein